VSPGGGESSHDDLSPRAPLTWAPGLKLVVSVDCEWTKSTLNLFPMWAGCALQLDVCAECVFLGNAVDVRRSVSRYWRSPLFALFLSCYLYYL